MANVLLTSRCNLKCPYCFASDFVGSRADDMSIESFIKILDFVSPDREIGLIGGEPLIYDKIDTVLDILANDYRFSRVSIFTNGVKIDKHIDSLCFSKAHILINLNSPSDIGIGAYDKVSANIDMLLQRGMKNQVTLGLNIYKENQDFEPFLDIVKKHGFKRVRVCVTIPNGGGECQSSYFLRMKETLFSFYSELYKLGVAPCYDCNVIPSCYYTDEEKAFLSKLPYFSEHERSLLLGETPVCSPIIDIYPDGSATRCFGCSSDARVKIDDFKNINDLKNYFFMWIDSKRVHIPSREECKDCYKFKTFACFGGCLCYKK